jgi:hypothetical protein
MVRGAHDDGVVVGEGLVGRVVHIEGIAPHGRPHIVGLEAQEELEDLLVHFAVDAAEFFRGPAGKRRRLVVKENAAVFDCRLTQGVAPGHDGQSRLLFHRHVRPPVPGRHADLGREFVHAVGRAPPVAPGNDEGLRYPGARCGYCLQDEGLPLAGYSGGVELFGRSQLVDEPFLPERADDDDIALEVRHFGGEEGLHARHPLNVLGQVSGRDRDHLEIGLVVIDDGGFIFGRQNEIALGRDLADERLELGEERDRHERAKN